MVTNPVKLRVVDPDTSTRFEVHKHIWDKCIRCPIGKQAKHHVFARGTLPCDVLFVGEAPGSTENELGFPFVGPAGELLDTWLTILPEMHLDYAITNMVCCMPLDLEGRIRQPTRNEMAHCDRRLREMMLIANPRMIVTLGRIADRNLPNVLAVPRLRMLHPAAILRCGGSGSISDGLEIKKLREFLERYS